MHVEFDFIKNIFFYRTIRTIFFLYFNFVFIYFLYTAFAQVLGGVTSAWPSAPSHIARKHQRTSCDGSQSECIWNTTSDRSAKFQTDRAQRRCVRPVTKRFSSHCHTSMQLNYLMWYKYIICTYIYIIHLCMHRRWMHTHVL